VWNQLNRSATRHAETIKRLGQRIPWLYKAAAQLYIDRKFPRHIFIETTAKCNLTCSFCPRELIDNHMDYSLFKRIIDEASAYGPRSFSMHLFGEPLLWPEIVRGIKYIKWRDPRNTVLLTTNGTHLNRFVEDLVRIKVDEILWTWRPEVRFRPRTLDLLRRETIKRTTRFRVRLIKQLTPPEEFERWRKWPYVDVKNLHNYGGEIELSKWNVPPAGKRHPCYHLWTAPAVAWNGNILLCCSDPHHKLSLGNINGTSLASAWKGATLKRVREQHLKGVYEGPCKTCDVWKTYPDLWFSWQRKG